MPDILHFRLDISFKEAEIRLGQKEQVSKNQKGCGSLRSALLCSTGGTFLCIAADISSSYTLFTELLLEHFFVVVVLFQCFRKCVTWCCTAATICGRVALISEDVPKRCTK